MASNHEHRSARTGFRKKATPLAGFGPKDGKQPCPSCGAKVRFYNGKPEKHPEGGVKKGKWTWCSGK